jgi:predicted Rossmann-fold nucleotide-binding protein
MKEDDSAPNNSEIVSLNDEAAVKKILVESVLGLWEVVNNLTRLRPSKKERYRVTIFGSARVGSDTAAFEEVKRLAQVLTEMGCDVITGGGPGLMLAANEGAASAKRDSKNGSIGIRVDLPFEQEVNPFVQEVFEHRTFLRDCIILF